MFISFIINVTVSVITQNLQYKSDWFLMFYHKVPLVILYQLPGFDFPLSYSLSEVFLSRSGLYTVFVLDQLTRKNP